MPDDNLDARVQIHDDNTGDDTMGTTKAQAQERAQERAQAIAQLRPMLRTGKAIHTRTQDGRGMVDYVGLEVDYRGKRRDITYLTAVATGARYNDRRGMISMSGYGYSKAFQAVYNLGRVMRPDFRCTGSQTCPSNDHVNERRAEDGYRKGRRHSDGGYAFRCEV